MIIFGIFNKLLSTQNVNVARFARNVKCDFSCDFQTLCIFRTFLIDFSIFPYHIQPLEVTVGKDSDEELNRLEIPEKRVHRFHVLANRRSMGPRKKKTH